MIIMEILFVLIVQGNIFFNMQITIIQAQAEYGERKLSEIVPELNSFLHFHLPGGNIYKP